jgi:probable F420-dependent oxidoreductase
MEPTDPMLDPLPALTWVAAHTTTLLLGTGILLMPQRNPVALAKEVASLDVLSGGRFLLGVGVGYLQPEFDAVGVPMEGRGERTMEYLAAMQALWGMDAPEYHGKYVSFSGVDAYPRPTRREGPPVVMAGHSAPAYRRSVQAADEWYGFRCDLDRTKVCIDGLKAAQDRYGLGRAKDRLAISITPSAPLTAELIDGYRELGVDRLIVLTGAKDRDGYLQFLESTAKTAGIL